MDNETGNDTAETASDSDSTTKENDVLAVDIPPGKITSNLDDFIWDIKALNFYMEPISKPSAKLDLYMKKCEERRTTEVKKIRSDVQNLNEEAEKCIRAAYEILKCELKGVEGIIENWKQFVCSGEIPLTNVMMENHKILNLTALKSLLAKRRKMIFEFHKDIISIEYNRRNKGSAILQNYFKSCTKLSMQKPGEIRELMEFEILKTNQIILSNLRYYEDVKLNLLLHGEKIETSFRDFLDKCRRNFALRILQTLRDETKKTDIDKYFFTTEEGKKVMKSLYAARHDINSIIKKQTGQIKYTPSEAESTAAKIQRAAENLDDCAKHVISIYKKVTYNVFQGQISALEKVQQEYLHLPPANQLQEKDTEMEELQEKIFAPLFEKQGKHSQYISELEVKWAEMMTEMQTSLQSTFLFLRDSSKIWDRHFERTKETKHMINMKLVTLIADQTVGELMLEKDLNVALDMLRQEPVINNLQNLLNKVYSILDTLQMIYINNNVERTKSLDKYMSAMEAETKILLAEMDKFMEVYPNEFVNDYFEIQPNSLKDYQAKSECRMGESEQAIDLPMELQKCQYQTDALRNWKLGLREAMSFYSTVCAKEISANTKRWMERQSLSLKRSLEAKLAIHHARYNREKTEIYAVRMAELQYHHHRLESHSLAVRNTSADLSFLFSEFEEKIEQDEEKFKEYLAEVTEAGSEATNSMAASKLALEATEKFKNIRHMFESSFDVFQNEITKTMEWINSANTNYLRSLKLFSEGGNYHPHEVASITKELEKLVTEADVHTKDLLAQAKQKASILHHLVIPQSDVSLQRLKGHHEDLQFIEKIDFAIKRVREFIKKEVRNLKYNRKLICLKVEQLLTDMPGSGGLDLLSFIEEYWESLLSMAFQHCAYLLQPNPSARQATSDTSTPADIVSKSKVGLRFKGFDIGNRPKSEKSHNPAERKVENRKYLFNIKVPPLDGSSFMENVCRTLWDVMIALENVALVFYKLKRKSPITKNDLVKNSYSQCMQDIIMRFKYYHLQCEDVWLKEVKVYYALLKRMQSVSNIFAEHAIRQFHQNRVNAVSDNHKLFLENLAKRRSIEDDTRLALDRKLKPLHGYPGNKEILAELIKEVHSLKSSISDSAKDYIVQYKGYLKDRKHFYKLDIEALGLQIQKIITTLYNPEYLLGELMEQAEEVVSGRKAIAAAQEAMLRKKRGKSPKKKKGTPDSSEKKRSKKKGAGASKGSSKKPKKKKGGGAQKGGAAQKGGGAQKEEGKKGKKGKKKAVKNFNIKVPDKYLLEMESPKKTADKAVTTDPCASEAQDSSTTQTQTQSTEEVPVDFVALVEDAKKKFVQQLKFCSRQSVDKINGVENDLDNWQKSFMKNVEQVKGLYKFFVQKWTK